MTNSYKRKATRAKLDFKLSNLTDIKRFVNYYKNYESPGIYPPELIRGYTIIGPDTNIQSGHEYKFDRIIALENPVNSRIRKSMTRRPPIKDRSINFTVYPYVVDDIESKLSMGKEHLRTDPTNLW